MKDLFPNGYNYPEPLRDLIPPCIMAVVVIIICIAYQIVCSEKNQPGCVNDPNLIHPIQKEVADK